MRLNHRRLNSSDKGYRTFEFLASVDYQTGMTTIDLINQYLEVRDWCAETFGQSCERDFYLTKSRTQSPVNNHWAWHTEAGCKYIYFVTEGDLAFAMLRFQD